MAEKRKVSFQIVIPVIKLVPHDEQGVAYNGCPAGMRPTEVGKQAFDVTVEVSVDWDEIVRVLGAKAFQNATGRCRDGFVTVKVLEKKKRV